MKLSSNQNETFSTFSLTMSASFDVNWMTSSLIIYAYLIMQIKVQNRKLKNLGKTCRKFFFLTLFSIILVFEAKTNMFSTNSFIICYSFAKNKIFENSKMAAKMVDML